ncbi:hypothetical protein Tco_0799905 [Tanacetum coccineum]|uniref:Uncharacterized protein n=1 Tax=Tanacetum coccineum TaxID=301880 RepID=A0ABQ4ZVG7_9ASTR
MKRIGKGGAVIKRYTSLGALLLLLPVVVFGESLRLQRVVTNTSDICGEANATIDTSFNAFRENYGDQRETMTWGDLEVTESMGVRDQVYRGYWLLGDFYLDTAKRLASRGLGRFLANGV